MSNEKRGRLREVAALFFKLGVIGFGGPAAHIALMEDEVVEKRAWLSRERFLDLVGVTSIIPGPNSTEMAIHLGFLRGGWPGLLLAGLCFIFPAVTLTTILAWAYMTYGAIPEVCRLALRHQTGGTRRHPGRAVATRSKSSKRLATELSGPGCNARSPHPI